MYRLIVFAVLSVPLVALSWKALKKPGSHGFYRFFLWECILALFLLNYQAWFVRPFSWHQILSWIFLLYSIYPVVDGVRRLNRAKKSSQKMADQALYRFESTAELVDKGIFKYIRHPMYSSLLFLAWGIVLKAPSLPLLCIGLAAGVFAFLTAWGEEKEDIEYFGSAYLEYKKRTKWLVPFIL